MISKAVSSNIKSLEYKSDGKPKFLKPYEFDADSKTPYSILVR